MKQIEDRVTRKEALAVWVSRIIEDWDGLRGRIASFWSAAGRKDAAQQLETAAAEFPEVVAPLSKKIETHNAALEAEAVARRRAEVEAERIRKAELARQQSNTGLKR